MIQTYRSLAAWASLVALTVCPLTASAAVLPSDLVGVWSGEQLFGPAIRVGDVHVVRTGPSWSATLDGVTSAGQQSGDTLVFRFAKGELRTRRVGNDLVGQWIQPNTVSTGYRFATPVAFAGRSGAQWRGRLEPLADSQHVDLIVQRALDGTLSAFIRNPEQNFGARIGDRSVAIAGDRITLGREGEHGIVATLDPIKHEITVHLEPFPGVFVLRKLHPADARVRYSTPAQTGDGWKTGTLGEAGIDQGQIQNVLDQLSAPATSPRSPYIQSLLIARHGRLVLDAYFNGFDSNRPHDVRSAGKSVATLLVGAALQHNPLLSPSTTVDSLFPQYLPYAHDDARKHRITIGELMSMSSGLACDDNDDASPGLEDTMQSQTSQPDWYKFTLDLPLVSDPGTKATYCSAGINLLGGVVTNATGQWLPDYFYERFAKPMQFGSYAMWLTPPPLNTAYMAGGDYFLPRDFLKFGQLFLNRGYWNGMKIIDDAWLKASITPRSGLSSLNDYGYGWHLLDYVVNGKEYKAFNAGGNGGQLLIVVPQLDIALMMTAANYGQYPVWQRFATDLVPRRILSAVAAE